MKTFYLKQKVFSIGDKYKIYDEKEKIIYYAKSKLITFTPKITLYKKQNDKKLFYICKKFFSILPKYYMYKDDKLVVTVTKKFTLAKHDIDIESEYGSFKVKGNFFAHDFEIYKDKKLVTEIHKAWVSWGDTYEIKIHDDSNTDFYIAIVVMIDNCIHNEEKDD